MRRVRTFKNALVAAGALAVFGLQSCSKDAEGVDIPDEAQLSQAELQTIMETGEYTSAVDEVLTDLFQDSNTATAKFADDSCYQATYTETGFTVVFGNCLLNQTENVNGTLEVVYNTAGSFTAIYKGFFVGTAKVDGTRTFTLTQSGDTGFEFSVSSEMTVVLEDGSTLAESGTRTLQIELGEALADIRFSISGSWDLAMDQTSYQVTVTTPVSGNLSCGYPVSGVMEISKNGLQVGVDFGDGTCDDKVTVRYPNGATEVLTL